MDGPDLLSLPLLDLILSAKRRWSISNPLSAATFVADHHQTCRASGILLGSPLATPRSPSPNCPLDLALLPPAGCSSSWEGFGPTSEAQQGHLILGRECEEKDPNQVILGQILKRTTLPRCSNNNCSFTSPRYATDENISAFEAFNTTIRKKN
ncbi:hypothetical protein NL676_036493 [Syzygium grande]|nr:hypothetical protein NL676_036493 [Syzygium grande]